MFRENNVISPFPKRVCTEMEIPSEETLSNNIQVELKSIVDNCRICLKKSTDVWHVFQRYEEIPRKIMACTKVQVQEGDGLPSVICYNCRQLLDVSYDFKCLVEKSDAELRQILEIKPLIYENSATGIFTNSVNYTISDKICAGTRNQSESDVGDQIAKICNSTNEEDINIDNSAAVSDKLNKCLVNIEMKDDNSVKIEEISITHDIINDLKKIKNSSSEYEVMDSCLHEKTLENDEESEGEKLSDDRRNKSNCLECSRSLTIKSVLNGEQTDNKNKTMYQYVCYMCDEKFCNIAKLKNHVTSHDSLKLNNKNQFEDIQESQVDTEPNDECEKSDETNGEEIGETLRIIKENSQKDDKKKFKYPCKFCSKQFTYEKSFLSHAKKHTEYEEDAGSEAQMRIENKDEREVESEDEEMPLESLQCTQCGKVFATKRNLQRHLSTHSGLKFNCRTCDKEFSRLDKLKEHEQSKHNDEFFRNTDDDDDEDDDTDNENKRKNFENKKKKKHNRPHLCSMCPKAFAHAQSLTNHMERHKRVKEPQKRFLCEICSKCFAQSGSLVAHMRTHTGVKPYVCNICSRAFTKSTYLQLHLRTHSGEKPYICQYCSRAFARANTLARHITMHTGEAKYHCQICRKSFRRLTSLNEHTYTHTGQRPYACKICTKRYNNAGSLYAHTKKCRVQQLNMDSIAAYPTENTALQDSSNSSSPVIYLPKKLVGGEVIDQGDERESNIVNSVDNNQHIVGPSTDDGIITTDAKNSYYMMFSGL